MNFGIGFLLNGILLGTGLAMDAFSVSLANGLNEPNMKKRKVFLTTGIFSFFQFIMPLIGWFLVSTLAKYFVQFQKLIPWIALFLLGYLGSKMIYEGVTNCDCKDEKCSISIATLLTQGVATSIDALSVGFTTSDYNFVQALLTSILISITTFILCYIGILIGKKVGKLMAGKATIFGGIILIFIGFEIFIKNFL